MPVRSQVIYLPKAELSKDTAYPMHHSSVRGVEDMSTLAELHEAAIMHNLFLRYQRDNIYVRNRVGTRTARPPSWRGFPWCRLDVAAGPAFGACAFIWRFTWTNSAIVTLRVSRPSQ